MKTEKVIEYIVDWLSEYIQSSRMECFVVGVSGGIDSAVTSTLCALTGHKTIVVNMPIRQNPAEVTRSDEHMAWLTKNYSNVESANVDLTPIFENLESELPKDIQDDLTMANSRSRLRMLTLYAFAGGKKGLVAGTGNKVEDFGIGFFTKYGDGGVDVSPIADLLKSQVYAIGKHMGVVESILTAPPTDGLWNDSRNDEDQIGATYNELEWAMDFVEKDGNINLLSDRERDVIAIYLKFHNANKHKMVPIPVCSIPQKLLK